MIGVRKKAICMMLPTIGGMSRKRAQNAPSSRQEAMPSTIQTKIAGTTIKATGPGQVS